LPLDDSSIRKYSSHNILTSLAELIGYYVEKREDFSKDQTRVLNKRLEKRNRTEDNCELRNKFKKKLFQVRRV
jgi:hypothetical protein